MESDSLYSYLVEFIVFGALGMQLEDAVFLVRLIFLSHYNLLEAQGVLQTNVEHLMLRLMAMIRVLAQCLFDNDYSHGLKTLHIK